MTRLPPDAQGTVIALYEATALDARTRAPGGSGGR